MIASQAREKARESLAGNWSKAAAITLIFAGISFIISLLDNIPYVGTLLVTILTLPLSYGLMITFLKIKRKEEVTYFSFLKDGFSNFKNVWFVALRVIQKVLPWLVLLIFAIILLAVGITLSITLASGLATFLCIIGLILYIVSFVFLFIKGLSYAIVYYLLQDNPDLPAKEIVEKSQDLMEGNKKRYFCLSLSFIGWALLSIMTFGIGYFFLLPYMQMAIIHFYEDLIETKK